jgi:hypothetical protein
VKFKILLIIICFTASSFTCANGDEIEKSARFAGQWPYHPSKSITTDLEKSMLILGDGDTITLLDFDLKSINSFHITNSSQIGGLFYRNSDQALFIATRTDGLKIFNLSNPIDPREISSYRPSANEILGVYVDENLAYLASGINGLLILDISTLSNPALISESTLPGGYGLSYAIDIYSKGSYAYIADLYNGIHIVDISKAQSPDYTRGITLPGAADLTVFDDFLYSANQGNGFSIIDITDPENPQECSLYIAEGVETAARIDSNFAYITYNTPYGLRILDITDKKNPISNPDWVYTASGATSLSILQNTNDIFIANEQYGLQKIDVTDKANIQIISEFDTPADAIAIDILGDHVVTVDDKLGNDPAKEGLRIHQISAFNNVTQFFFKGFCETPGTANDVIIDNDFVFIADGEHGLQIVDILDINNPYIISNLDTDGTATGIFINKNYAYVADGEQGITIIYISDKLNPVKTAVLKTADFANDIFVNGNYAYVADGKQGLQIIDITDINNPFIIGNLDTDGTSTGIFVDNNYAYIADGEQGIAIINIADKSSPTLSASIDTAGYAEDVSISGNYAYVADGLNGMFVIDISDPTQPVEETGWSYNSTGYSSKILGGYFTENEELYAFIADGAAGVIGINLTSTEDQTDNSDDLGGTTSSGGCFIRASAN